MRCLVRTLSAVLLPGIVVASPPAWASTASASAPSSSSSSPASAPAPAPAPARAPAVGDPLRVQATRFALKNGLTVVLVEDHSVPRVHLSVRIHAGSARERPGRTGFAHLFEHLMFEGSRNVPEGKFDEWLEAAGGTNNAWTSEDFTYYFEEAPSNALDLLLFLESDRLGFFLDKLDATLVDGQRDVVKNERRQSGENRPYGIADLAVPRLLWPKGHPYSWPVIGSMDDLTAASVADVRDFFSTWYAPENAVLVLVGDFQTEDARARIAAWFDDVPARGGRPAPAPAPHRLVAEHRAVFEDDVELPRVSLVWPSDRLYGEDDARLDLLAAALSHGESSRLVRRLVHELRLAQAVSAYQESRERAGQFVVEVLAFPGTRLADVVRVVDEEVARLLREGPAAAELARGRVEVEAAAVDHLDSLAGKAERISAYATLLGDPDALPRDLERYRQATAADVAAAGRRTLTRGRLVLSVVPRGRLDLAVLHPVLPATAALPRGIR
jgi:zinc protease